MEAEAVEAEAEAVEAEAEAIGVEAESESEAVEKYPLPHPCTKQQHIVGTTCFLFTTTR